MRSPVNRSAAILAGKFLVFLPICLVVWLLFLPVYAHILGHAAAGILRHGLGYQILEVRIRAAGFLNTEYAERPSVPVRSEESG